MDQAEIVDAASGKVVGHAVNFVRLPFVGEIVAGPNGGWSHVTAVVHNWQQGAAIAAIYVTPPAAHMLAGNTAPGSWQQP